MKKTKYIKTKMNFYCGSAALMTLISATSLCHAMDEPKEVDSKSVTRTQPASFEAQQLTLALTGDKDAQRKLGKWCMNKNRELAIVFYESAAKQGDMNSANALGNLLSGEEEKMTWHLKAAEEGHSESQLLVGNHYRDKGDLEAAEKWFTLAVILLPFVRQKEESYTRRKNNSRGLIDENLR